MASSSRVSVALRVFGETLEPEEVSALLGCEPTRSQRRGDEIAEQSKIRIAETGAWFLDSDVSDDAEPETHVESILGRLTADPDEWASLTSRYAADLFCGLLLGAPSQSFEISPRLAHALSERGLAVVFDIDSSDAAG